MLQQLGINGTVFIQLAIYLFTFTTLIFLVYTPFVQAYDERQKKTKGTEDIAHEYAKKTNDLQTKYQQKAREINSQIQDIYKKNKAEATQESEAILNQAKKEALVQIEQNRKVINQAIAAASSELKSQTAQIALSITNRLLGKT